GEIQNFTGVNDPYEEPENPDLVCDTDVETVEESVAKVLGLLEEKGYIEAGSSPVRVTAVREAAKERVKLPGPSVPHGGVLVNRELTGAAREEALERAKALPKFELDERELADVEMIGIGALSPLTGFMRRLDYETVVEQMRLSDGLVWSMPV